MRHRQLLLSSQVLDVVVAAKYLGLKALYRSEVRVNLGVNMGYPGLQAGVVFLAVFVVLGSVSTVFVSHVYRMVVCGL